MSRQRDKELAALWPFVIVGLVMIYIKWILLFAAALALIAGVILAGMWIEDSIERRRTRLQAIADRADQQHQLVMRGDPAGTYGSSRWEV